MQREWLNPRLIKICLLVVACGVLVGCGSPPTPSPTPQQSPTPTPTAQPQQTEVVPTATPTKGPEAEVFVEGIGDITHTKVLIEKKVNIEFVLDASGSMRARIGEKSKLQIAKEVLAELLERLPPKVSVGLRVYGHRYAQEDKAASCNDIELLAPIGPVSKQEFSSRLQPIEAKGWTPIAKSLEQAAADMPVGEYDTNNVILISDGEETCGGEPVAVAKKVKQSDIDLTIHTISFAATEKTKEQLQLIAQYSGGTYHEAEDSISLLRALEGAVATQKGTFLRVEVTGENGRQVSTSVIIRDPTTGKKRHQFVTWLDAPVAPGTFDIIVGTAPRTIYSRRLLEKDTSIVIKLSTGALRVELTDANNKHVRAPVELRDPRTGSLLRNFFTWYNQIALSGTYDITVITVPPMTRKGVQVETGKLTVVPMGTGLIHIELLGVGGNRIRSLVELRDPESDQLVRTISTWQDHQIMAGVYDLVIQDILGAPHKQMKIESGETKVLKFNGGLLRVELTDKTRGQLSLPVSLVEPTTGETLGQFSTWDDQRVLEGDYQLVIKEVGINQSIKVEGGKHTLIKLESPG